MALSVFDDKSAAPARQELEVMLGATMALWDRIVAGVSDENPPIIEAWNFAGAKFGWSMRLKRKDRVLLYLIPQTGHFLAAVVLGEKAVTAAHTAGLPPGVIAAIDAARPYAEGRGIRLPVRNIEDVEVILELARIKLGK